MPGRRRILVFGVFLAAWCAAAATAQQVNPGLGVDPRVDYSSFVEIGPWDDRNYLVTQEDLALLAPNERELKDPIPVFFRIELRKANPGMLRTGVAQYPRSALQIFKIRYGGYRIGNRIYREAVYRDGRFEVLPNRSIAVEDLESGEALTTDVRVTSPAGAAESAVKIHPTDLNKVIAGSNGPGFGQIMWYSTNGGASWSQSAALPQGNTCCDPTVDWSSNGQYAYTSTLGGCGGVCNVWVYRSSDGGATWNDLATITPGDGRREVTSASISDKQYMHVDKFATSPFRDNIYQCWHDNGTLKFSRSTDFAHTWSAPLTMSSGTSQSGIGCDLTTDRSGNLYYFWPATNGKTILMRKSTNGGASFATAVTVATTQDGYDFAIPAMETRRAFIYASADGDVSGGTYANSIYAAWTDTTAPESGTPANNHGRIQIAWSRNGGATWTVRTPHETADAATVDRFHPWIGVGPDGKVYVMFYDTRRSATRVGVDVFYSVSSDGGDTWATPARLTSVLSPQIDDSFEWGDYNGLDVVGSQLITIFTDNRNEGGGAADSIDVYASGLTVGGPPCTAPGAPVIGGAAVAAGTPWVQVTWSNGSPGSAKFNVYRAPGTCAAPGAFTRIATSVAGSPHLDTTVASNTTYAYHVKGLDAITGNCESAASGCAQATTPCASPPSFAGLASATNNGTATCGVTLAWSAAAATCGGSVTYRIYRSTSAGFAPSASNRIATDVTGTGYTDSSPLTSGVTYYYVVRAVDGSNSVEDANAVTRSATPTGPAATGTLIETFEGALSGGGFDNAGWTHNAVAGAVDWVYSTASSQTPTHSWLSASQTTATDRVLVSPPFAVQAGTTLSFWHTYAFEGSGASCYDGGTLEISTNGGSTWSVMPDAAFTAGLFNGTVNTGYSNPLGGKRAWCGGTAGAMTQVNVNLGSFAGSANTKLRWHAGDDSSFAATGWYVDSVTLANVGIGGACAPAPPAPADFYTITPCRVADTRNPAGPLGGPALAASAGRTFVVTGTCGVPATARAVVVNATVIQPAAEGFLSLYPGNLADPGTSYLNFPAGVTRSNNGTLLLSTDGGGGLTVTNGSAGALHFALDVTGYYQ